VSAAQWADLMPGKFNLDPLDQLFDIVCELPQTLESVTTIFSSGQFADREIEVAVTTLWSILRNIRVWQARFCAATTAPLYTAVPSKLSSPSDYDHHTKLFPFALEFRSLQTATHLMIAWAFQLHIYSILQFLLQEIGGTRTVPPWFVDSYTNSGSIQHEADKLARLLCQSVEYCHRIEMGTFGPQTMIYPQWIMRQYLARYGTERELQWCNNIGNMGGMETRCSIKLMAFQGSFEYFKRVRE
jgi:hypothetical protein